MNFKRMLKTIAVILAAAGILSLIVWGFFEGRKEIALEQERERPIKAPLRVSSEYGETVVTFDQATQIKSGITVAPLAAAAYKEEVLAYGTVLQTQELVELGNNYSTSRAQIKKMDAALDASKKEYERLKPLNANNRNVSDKALQGAEAAWLSDEAALSAAHETLRSIENTATQKWGRVIAAWLTEKTPSFKRLAEMEDALLQITFPADINIKTPPLRIQVQSTSGIKTHADFVSPAAYTDPRIQGMSFLYTAKGVSVLVPGMNIQALLPLGESVSGVLIPDSAVVWWQGKAWIYTQKDAGQFVRTEIPASNPVEDGYFVVNVLRAGDRIVVNGAQTLLSEEFRSQIQVGEEGSKK